MADVVIVPPSPGPVLRPAAGRDRRRDDLDDVVDELFPDTEEGPGLFDAVLVAGGGGLLAWGALAGGPDAALVAGPVAVALGCVLPVRAAWRARTARRQAALARRGAVVDAGDRSTAALVAAYERLLAVAPAGSPAAAAAHGAVREVALLLEGRPPASERERRYVDERTTAVVALAAALSEAAPATRRAAVLDAREELDRATGSASLDWLRTLTDEATTGRDRDA